MTRTVALLTILCAALAVRPTSSQTTTTPATTPAAVKPGQATGERIGNAISAAITTAFPAAQKIIDVIWPNKTQKKTAANATPDLVKAKTAADTNQNENFAAISAIADELTTMRTFLNYCVVADEHITAIQTTLANKTALTPQDVTQIGKDWDFANLRIAKLGSAEIQTQIAALKPTDTFVQQTLGNIADANLGLIQGITKEVDALTKPNPPLDALRVDINSLKTYLTGVNSLAGIVIGDIGLGLKSTKDLTKGAQGGKIDNETKDEYTAFNNRLTALYPKKKKP
jgi:hypothetical protein